MPHREGPAKRARYGQGPYHRQFSHHNPIPSFQPQYHYFSNGTWQHPSTFRESRYSDFVPCTYDERTLLTRLFKYARAFLSQTSNRHSQQTLLGSGSGSQPDIEMIATSPSPTLHSSTASPSPRPSFHLRANNGSSRYPPPPVSPHSYVKPPSPAAFPRHVSHSPSISHKRPFSSAKSPSPPPKQTVDAGTQYSPPSSPSPPKPRGKRRGRSPSPPMPPSPPLAPQVPPNSRPTTSASRPLTASSATPANPFGNPHPTTSISSSSSSTTASSSSVISSGSSPKRARPPRPATKLMPAAYSTCDVKDLVILISNMLMELIRFNDDIPLGDGRLTRFHSRAPPGISVRDYLQRLTTHATLSPPILLSMVYYIDRLCALYPAFTISSLTVHRFLITSATVASKGLSDSFWTNTVYARVGGVSMKELALLELEFLWRVEWRIVPRPEMLEDYYRSLVERSDGFEIESVGSGSRSGSGSFGSEGDSMTLSGEGSSEKESGERMSVEGSERSGDGDDQRMGEAGG